MADRDYDKTTFVPYEKPPVLGRWESAKLTIWNPREKSFLGRTFKSWGLIIAYYICFYAALAALYVICLQGLFYTLSDQRPAYILDESLIGSNPGLGFRPISETVDVDGSIIWYKPSNETQCHTWISRTDAFLEPYRAAQGGYNQVKCDYRRPPGNNEVCAVDVEQWAPCNAEHGYSYNQSAPCIFLKLNRIYGWVPRIYNNVSDLPEGMPDDLKKVIQSTSNETLNNVWLHCHGVNPGDRENIGPIEYYPQQGFPAYYYPYLNTPGYLSPLVAIRLARPNRNILIAVECVAYAKNIRYSNTKGVREGSVYFEFLID